MYDESEQLVGWAVEIKTERSSNDGKGWFWYEIVNTTDGTATVAIGNGVAGCSGCHSRGGLDFVMTSWPLR